MNGSVFEIVGIMTIIILSAFGAGSLLGWVIKGMIA